MEDAGAAAPASDRKPSQSIWKNCPNTLLNDLGLGRYVHEDFYAVNPQTVVTTVELVQGDFMVDADTGVVFSGVLPVDQTGGRLDMETPATDNDAVAIFQQVGPGLVMNSGIKVWFEARFSIGELADHGTFIGLAEEDGLDRDIILDDGVLVGTESMFGFFISSGDVDDLMAVWNLDTGTGTVVLQDITAAAIYYDQVSGGASASIVATTYYKVGMYFDGVETLSYFLNGYKVAELVLVAATHPDDVEMGPIFAFKTGTAGARSANLDWMRYAHQEAN